MIPNTKRGGEVCQLFLKCGRKRRNHGTGFERIKAIPACAGSGLWGGKRFRERLLPEMDLCSLASRAGALIGEAVERGPGIPAGLRVTLFRFVLVTARTLKQMDLFPLGRAHPKFILRSRRYALSYDLSTISYPLLHPISHRPPLIPGLRGAGTSSFRRRKPDTSSHPEGPQNGCPWGSYPFDPPCSGRRYSRN
jgi:hypothetical protein